MVVANISKFQKNVQRKIFDCLFGINSLLKCPTVPRYYWLRLTGIAYK